MGITRAMDRLYLVHARARTLWGTASYNMPSRFIAEIPPRLLEKHIVGGPAAGQSGGWSGASSGSGKGSRSGGSSWSGGGSWGGSSSSGRWSGAGGRQGSWDDDDGALPPVDGSSGRRFTGLEKKLDEQVVEQYFAIGERVLHATLGEGTVLAMEGGGIVLVHFENDGSERRLMASVAPLRKLRD